MPVALLAAVLVAAAPQQQLRAAELEDVSSRIQGSDWPACPQLVPPARNSAWSRLAAQILGAATGVKSRRSAPTKSVSIVCLAEPQLTRPRRFVRCSG